MNRATGSSVINGRLVVVDHTMLLGLLVTAAAVGSAGICGARMPELDSVTPWTVQLGDEVELELSGERLEAVTGLLFLKPGIEVVEYRAIDDERGVARVRVHAGCEIGEHPLWAFGPDGLSELAVILTTPFSTQDEAEPNSKPAEANRVPLRNGAGVSVLGTIDDGDVDCYRVTLSAGERLSAEVDAIGLGRAFLDAYLDVLDPGGRVVASNDDTALTAQDPSVSLVAETPGVYTVRVRESAFGGDYESHYSLHLGHFERPQIAFPSGGPGGEVLKATLFGDSAGPLSVQIPLPAFSGGLHSYRHTREGVATPTPLKIRVSSLRNYSETGDNMRRESADDVGRLPVAINGILGSEGASDWYRFSAEKGELFEAELYGARLGSPIDSVIEIFGPDGDPLVSNDDAYVHDSRLVFRAYKSGGHLLRVSDHLGHGGEEYIYRVEFRRPVPAVDICVPVLDPLRPRRGRSIAVPRGGRFVLPIAVRRTGEVGQVRVEVSGLPDGVNCEPVTIDQGQHLALLNFEAGELAAIEPGFVDIAAYAETSAGTIESVLRPEVSLVLGEPRQTVYHAIELERMPFTVTREAPFEIVVRPPAAPLAKDGMHNLAVELRRRPGFTGPVKIRAAQLPDWIERSEDPVVIAPGETSVEFPLICRGQAEVGGHGVVLSGDANVMGGAFTASTPVIPVEVIAPHAEVTIHDASTEQGVGATIRCSVDWLKQASGPVVAILRGLPKQTEAKRVRLAAGDTSCSFEVLVGEEAPASIHNTLYVELLVPEGRGVVREYLGRGGTLEIYSLGSRAREPRSRLEVLRSEARAEKLIRTRVASEEYESVE